MEYTSNQRAAIFLVARWTNKLKNNMPIGMYLKELPEVKKLCANTTGKIRGIIRTCGTTPVLLSKPVTTTQKPWMVSTIELTC